MQKSLILSALSTLAFRVSLSAGESNVDQALLDELERIGDARKAPDYKEFKAVPAHVKGAAHRTTEGVKVFQSTGAAQPWGDSNKASGQAVAVAFEYGKVA